MNNLKVFGFGALAGIFMYNTIIVLTYGNNPFEKASEVKNKVAKRSEFVVQDDKIFTMKSNGDTTVNYFKDTTYLKLPYKDFKNL